jgi:hypothetical protein
MTTNYERKLKNLLNKWLCDNTNNITPQELDKVIEAAEIIDRGV